MQPGVLALCGETDILGRIRRRREGMEVAVWGQNKTEASASAGGHGVDY